MKQLIFLALVALLFLQSCTHYHYTPNTLNIPMLQKQHDARISVARYSGGEAKGFEAQAIYSPVKYAGVMFNHLGIPRKTNGSNGNYTEWGRGRLTEGGIGAYYPYRALTLSMFGGFGGGWAENAYESNQTSVFQQETHHTNLHFRRWFLQPSLSVKVKWLQFGFGMRHVWLNYTKGHISQQIAPGEFLSIKNIESASPLGFWEKGFTLGLHFDWISLSFNKVWLSSKKHDFKNYQFNTNGSNICFSLNINELWEKNDESKQKRRNLPIATSTEANIP